MNLPKPRKIEVERYLEGLSKYKKISNPIKLSANTTAWNAADVEAWAQSRIAASQKSGDQNED